MENQMLSDWIGVQVSSSDFYSEILLAQVMEKLDGNIMTLYYYDSNWHVSTSKVPDASGWVPGQENVFFFFFFFNDV